MKTKKIAVLAIGLLLSLNIKAQPGNYCSLSPAAITGNWTVPFGGFRFYFTGQGLANTNAVGIGYTCGATLPSKLSVLQQTSSVSSAITSAASFINRDLNTSGTTILRGMGSTCDLANTIGVVTHIAGDFKAGGAHSNYAIKGTIVAGGNPTLTIAGDFSNTIGATGASYGVRAEAANGTTANYGVYTAATTSGSFVPSYGIYALNAGSSVNNKWAGWFQGDVKINGLAYCTASAWASDKRFKQNIKQLQSVSEKLTKLKGYTYEYNTEAFKEKNFSKGKQIGFLAQELKEVFPELVVENSDGYNYVNYIGMIPVLLEAIKEQQQQINELKAVVRSSAYVASNNEESTKNIGAISLSDAPSIILEQNVPNPFAEQTAISYSLNDGVQKAQILFYNADGKLINSSELKPTAGKGQLNVFAGDLSNGIYSYTLVVDGKIIETKRMIKTK